MNRTNAIINELKKTRGYENYNGWSNKKTEFGYHSFNIDEIQIQGQRNPKQRIDAISKHINFDNKVVADIASNVGGMLFHLKNIKKGIGFDFDPNVIEAATNICDILGRPNLTFKQFDFDRQDFEIFKKELTVIPDVVFFLAIAKWIKNWKIIYNYFIDLGADIIVETNETKSESAQLQFFEEKGLEAKLIIAGSPEEIVKNKSIRNTYYIENKILKKSERSQITKSHNSVITKFSNKDTFYRVKDLYQFIKNIKYVPIIQFYEENYSVKVPFFKTSLSSLEDICLEEKKEIKNQIIHLINELYKVKIAHKDLHTKNIFWDGTQIWIIDWEYISIDDSETIEYFYDLDSENGQAPINDYRLDIFSEHKNSIKNFLLPEIILNKEDFKKN